MLLAVPASEQEDELGRVSCVLQSWALRAGAKDMKHTHLTSAIANDHIALIKNSLYLWVI